MASGPSSGCPEEKEVLVCFGENKRPVKFTSGSTSDRNLVIQAFIKEYQLIDPDPSSVLLQYKSEHYIGEFVDVSESDSVHDKCVLRAVYTKDCKVSYVHVGQN